MQRGGEDCVVVRGFGEEGHGGSELQVVGGAEDLAQCSIVDFKDELSALA